MPTKLTRSSIPAVCNLPWCGRWACCLSAKGRICPRASCDSSRGTHRASHKYQSMISLAMWQVHNPFDSVWFLVMHQVHTCLSRVCIKVSVHARMPDWICVCACIPRCQGPKVTRYQPVEHSSSFCPTRRWVSEWVRTCLTTFKHIHTCIYTSAFT